MKNQSTISAKRQATGPAEIWELFGCAPCAWLDCYVLDDGRLMVRVMTSTRSVEKS
jgi:hypothetical protein